MARAEALDRPVAALHERDVSFATGSEDFGFRRSLTTAAGFSLDFTPDTAGKLSAADLSGPGSLQISGFLGYRYQGGRVIRRNINAAGGTDTLHTEAGY